MTDADLDKVVAGNNGDRGGGVGMATVTVAVAAGRVSKNYHARF
jgi:hypothetical protein